MRILKEKKGLGAVLLSCGLAGPAAAQEMRCVAEEQCRGDAEAMCAPSELSIDIARNGAAAARLWIDLQGPYPAALERREDGMRLVLDAFGGGYEMEIGADGAFVYRGNRGKRYLGTCEGAL
ncbi:hypothetical protein M4578_05050 [Salipiger sp. P9]|uniref:hypothetical protein n=1 Tax=Salipiger pentaromativorans TaxID=2943193 RepID=UPI0021581264|nr:hypothetical protein [Salipiger pentaromativorans]MCR8547184.1 hypothetical protein [Salipiger pentaromativorans]